MVKYIVYCIIFSAYFNNTFKKMTEYIHTLPDEVNRLGKQPGFVRWIQERWGRFRSIDSTGFSDEQIGAIALAELSLNPDLFPVDVIKELTQGVLQRHHALTLQRVRDADMQEVWDINKEKDLEDAAAYIAMGGRAMHPFGNILALTGHPHSMAVEHTNKVKGRPHDQTGSITASPEHFEKVFDVSHEAIPAELRGDRFIEIMHELFAAIGPFGVRGPASKKIIEQFEYLRQTNTGVFETQLIAVGGECPSHGLLRRASEIREQEFGEESDVSPIFFITSANMSRNITRQEEPAHYYSWYAAEQLHGLQIPVLGHGSKEDIKEIEQDVVHGQYGRLQPSSTTIVSLHKVVPGQDGEPSFVIERHGSADLDVVRAVVAKHGFGIITSSSQKRLSAREYF